MYEMPAVGFVRLKDILLIYPVSKSTWWVGVASGEYPKPVKLSKRTTAWRVEDIRELIQSCSERVIES
jgi:predicted DNA-binding transcriptional regulator AlpA